jgi:hypothetical protein
MLARRLLPSASPVPVSLVLLLYGGGGIRVYLVVVDIRTLDCYISWVTLPPKSCTVIYTS